ncbi:MAG: peptidoglycan DD-metalloendopeptidase family protein [Lachnospiraceae bacterium]|nr:peptidoglycan DD-metalloendopeptidase family protein [Lachnospiraceae bacterium]
MLVIFLGSIANTGLQVRADTESLQQSIKEKQAELETAEKEKKQLQGNISNVKKMVAELEKAKDDLEEYVTELDADLTDIEARIEDLKHLIADKEQEIEEATADLNEAEEIQHEQYESMKKRIKFMYERGDSFYLDMIFSAGSFAEMLNKADYAEMLSEYDTRKLEEYKETCEYIAACKADLEADMEVLEEAKAQVDAEQENLKELIDEKNDQISATVYDINNKEAAIKELEADLAAQTAAIQSIEQAIAEERRKLAEESGRVLTYDGGMFKWPAPSYTRISDDYGNRIHPILGVQQFHNGVDMAAPSGSPILAAYDGEVVAADYNASMGNYVMIDHGDSLYTIYMHASALYVSKGDIVGKGQKIAAVGSTGRSTGNHLHFSVRKDGSYVSPWNYLSN